MKVSIDSINSGGIRAEMEKDGYATAEFFGSFAHPTHEGNDWVIRLYYAADSLVIDTNGDPVWENQPGFEELLAEYRIDLATATAS
jgi:hypothetical protein